MKGIKLSLSREQGASDLPESWEKSSHVPPPHLPPPGPRNHVIHQQPVVPAITLA